MQQQQAEALIMQWVQDAHLGASRKRALLEHLEIQLVEEKLSPEKRTMLEEQAALLRQELASLQTQVLPQEQLQPLALWHDLTLIEQYSRAPEEGTLVPIRKAIHRLFRQLDPHEGLLPHVVQAEPLYPLSEATYSQGASTPFVLGLIHYQLPYDEQGPGFEDTTLGKTIYQALYNMMNIDEVLVPTDAAELADLGRQRIYEIARDHPEKLFPIYKRTNTERGTMVAYYLFEQVMELKRQKQEQYAHRRRPGPIRGAKKEKA